MKNPETKLAYCVTMYTLVGVGRTNKYPLAYGNCFSVATKKDKESRWSDEGDYRVVNFVLENLEHLLEEKVVEWPIKIALLDDRLRIAAVNDPRIPDEYYTDRFCEVCTPTDLLPAPQRLRHLRDIDRGFRTEHSNGVISTNYPRKTSKNLDEWKFEVKQDTIVEFGDDLVVDIIRSLAPKDST